VNEIREGTGSDTEDLYFESSEDEEDIPDRMNEDADVTCIEITTTTKEGDNEESNNEGTKATKKKLTVTTENLPYGHVCDDIAIDNDTIHQSILSKCMWNL
jgi:hypothetical protein